MKKRIGIKSFLIKFGNVSLKGKMQMLIYGMLIPFVIFITYLIGRMGSYSDAYDSIYNNISVANEFSQTFKESYDYSMYRIVIGSSTFEKEGVYDKLGQAKETISQLQEGAFFKENVITTKNMLEYLKSLEYSTKSIQKNLETEGPQYDKNMGILDTDIRTTTTMILDEVQEYVYYETFQMNIVRENIKIEIEKTVKVAIGLFIILLIVIFILSEIFSSSITKPLENLCSSIKLVGDGDFSTRVLDSGSDEITTLTTTFNTMTEKIEGLVDDVKVEQLNLRKTELKLMQAQINPHFLYNTLDTIIWLAESKKNEDVVAMVEALSKFFRIALSKGNDLITLKEEEMHVRSYLEIQQYRYQDILEYEINIPKELGECKILKLVLQPIVENALYHGIKNRRGMGKITVEGSYEKEAILLKIRDNGIGMTQEQLEKTRRILQSGIIDEHDGSHGFGLANVNGRLQLNYGSEFGITVTSTEGVGSEFTVRIPAITDLG